MRGWPVLALLVVAPLAALRAQDRDTERIQRTQMTWGGRLPAADQVGKDEPPKPGEPRRKPLLVYVASSLQSRDQTRFEEVVLKNESFTLMARFFDCVEAAEATAKAHPLFEGIQYTPPAVIVFDSTRRKHAVARGRASAMKATGIMRKIGQPDYVSPMKETVRKAKVLLGTFDQCDAARDALAIKRARRENALGKGDAARAKVLEKDIAKDEKRLDELHAKTDKAWSELWTLEIKQQD
jgi:hypothetical protein